VVRVVTFLILSKTYPRRWYVLQQLQSPRRSRQIRVHRHRRQRQTQML
jgi:hypothetical protein